jgi:two-component system NtrC family sensor kinase
MKYSALWLSISVFLLLVNVGFSQSLTTLKITSLSEETQLSLSAENKWQYQAVDNFDWQDKGKWELIDIRLKKGELPSDWNGAAIFRTSIEVDQSLYGKEVSIYGKLRGAAEIYVNGELEGKAGKIGQNQLEEKAVSNLPFFVFQLSDQALQTIEIRYTNFATEKYWNISHAGLDLSIGLPNAVEEIINENTAEFQAEISRYHFIFGFMVALGLLHLILFGFYPIEIANLTCSVFFFCLSGIFLSGIFFKPGIAPEELSGLLLWKGVFHIFAAIVLQFFIYQIMNKKFNWLPYLNLVVGLIVLVITIQDPVANSNISYFFFMITMVIGLILLINARIVHNMKGTNIIFVFFLVSFILVFPGLLKATFDISILWSNKLFFMNFATISAAAGYSFYLARGVSITNRQLSEKLRENMKLTMEKLKAEKEKQVLIEKQKEQLEQEVADRTMELSNSLKTLKTAQAQLIQQEKLASLGELTSGIAHEIQNPVNFINNFSELSIELIDELQEEKDKEISERDEELIGEILTDLKSNLDIITKHGKRADSIVKGMLAHSSAGKGEKQKVNLNIIIEEYLKLSLHANSSNNSSFRGNYQINLEKELPKINVVPQDLGRVILNLINNAFYATNDRCKTDNPDYKPLVTIETKSDNGSIVILVSDNGKGIPSKIKDKILQPFFTTKPTGEGTGLGLSLSYDIVKSHQGNLSFESEEGVGTTFKVELPIT